MLTLCLVRSDEDDLAFKEKQKKEAAELKALAAKGTFFSRDPNSGCRWWVCVAAQKGPMGGAGLKK